MLLPDSTNNCSISNNIAVVDPSLSFFSFFLLVCQNSEMGKREKIYYFFLPKFLRCSEMKKKVHKTVSTETILCKFYAKLCLVSLGLSHFTYRNKLSRHLFGRMTNWLIEKSRYFFLVVVSSSLESHTPIEPFSEDPYRNLSERSLFALLQIEGRLCFVVLLLVVCIRMSETGEKNLKFSLNLFAI